MPSLASDGHHVEHLADHFRVQRAGRLVEEHRLGLHRQGAGDRRPLLLAAGELGRKLVRLVGDADPVEQRHGPLAARPAGLAADLDRAERDVVEHGLVREQVERLEHHADLAAQPGQRPALGGQRLAVEEDRAGIDRLQPVDRPAQRGLARTGRADDDHDLTAGDRRFTSRSTCSGPKNLLTDVQHDERLSPDAVTGGPPSAFRLY